MGVPAALVAEFAPIRRRVAARLAELLAPDTALVLPTAPCIALRKGLAAAAIGEFYRRALTLACAAGHEGLPQLSLPLVEVDGCPAGLSVVTAAGRDEALLAMAADHAQPVRR